SGLPSRDSTGRLRRRLSPESPSARQRQPTRTQTPTSPCCASPERMKKYWAARVSMRRRHLDAKLPEQKGVLIGDLCELIAERRAEAVAGPRDAQQHGPPGGRRRLKTRGELARVGWIDPRIVRAAEQQYRRVARVRGDVVIR